MNPSELTASFQCCGLNEWKPGKIVYDSAEENILHREKFISSCTFCAS